MINRPKGTKDVVPNEAYKWQKVEELTKEVLKTRGFNEIRTPVFEHTELFVRGVGEGSDIVNKEMYTFLDKGERSITLKPEGTASIVRAVIENGLDNDAMPLKLFMQTPCFRYERPQAGRLREHHQFSIETFGSSSPSAEFEIIGVIKAVLDKLHFDNYMLNINTIGCKECRKNYVEVLKRYYSKNIEDMCDDCKVRFEKNALRLLDCKEQRCATYKANAPKPRDYLCDDCKDHYKKLKELLDVSGITYKENDNLVRGIDYYSRTVFEFLTNENGALGTICGGGRYDGLVEDLGGKPLPSVGVGIGIERLLSLLEKNNINVGEKQGVDLYIANASEQEYLLVVSLAEKLRRLGVSVEFDLLNRSLKAQMKYANKINARKVIIIGEEEKRTRCAKLKDMKTSTEKVVYFESPEDVANLVEHIKLNF